jgi:hypothetical protein
MEEPIIAYSGFLKPGLTINVSIPRENVQVSISFEVINGGSITFAHEIIPNMVTWHEIYVYFSNIDQRICPWENYIDEELRPYLMDSPLLFRLNSGLEIPDTTRNFGGVSGGQAPSGRVLPPIVFPKPAVNVTAPGDKPGTSGFKGPIAGALRSPSDSSWDSWEEELLPDTVSEAERMAYQELADAHKLRKMTQAVLKRVPITIEIGAAYVYGDVIHQAVFSKEVKITHAPSHVLELFQIAYKQIEQIGLNFQGGLPASLVWADSGVPREDIDVQVFKVGQGIYVRYAYAQEEALDMKNLPEQIKASLPLDWTVSFGTSANPVDRELTERMAQITISQTHPLWQIRLAKVSLRIGELGTPGAAVYKVEGQWDDFRQIPEPPMCAKEMPTFIEATIVKETQAMLRFGRDSNWPIKITLAARASPATVVSITYDINWEGLETTEEGEISTNWGWEKFNAKFHEESLMAPPALASGQGVWNASVRKENNSKRIILKEEGIWAPEDPDGPPPMILYGPKAVIKIRTTAQGPAALLEMRTVLGILYHGRYDIEQQVPTREWALVGSFGGGTIPMHSLSDPPEVSAVTAISGNGAILEAALKTQNYDKGFDKFIRKFNPAQEMSAVVSVKEGFQGDHGWAVAFQQDSRCCLLLDTADSLSKEEAMWVALSAWASFQPRRNLPRTKPGTLYYPDEASHVFQDFWNHLGNLPAAPGFGQCSPVCQ